MPGLTGPILYDESNVPVRHPLRWGSVFCYFSVLIILERVPLLSSST